MVSTNYMSFIEAVMILLIFSAQGAHWAGTQITQYFSGVYYFLTVITAGTKSLMPIFSGPMVTSITVYIGISLFVHSSLLDSYYAKNVLLT